MKLSALLWVATSLTAMAATEEQINKHFPVQPGGQLVVDVDFGSINISTNGTNEVVIDVSRKVSRSNKDDEQSFLKNAPVEITQEGNKVSVRCHAKTKLEHWFSWSFWGGNRTEAKYTITLPSQFNARATTAGGSINVRDLTGEVTVQTSGGSLEFARVQGPVDGSTSGGGIQAENCQGTLRINTSGGSLRINGGGGSLTGNTSGGSVTVKKYQGPAVVHTSGGGLNIENVGGTIDGSTSGGSIHAVLLSPLPGSVSLETSGGSVTVSLPEKAAFNVDAQTSAGSVVNELSMTTVDKKESSELRGAVNGGGQPVRLRTSAGSIHVKKL